MPSCVVKSCRNHSGFMKKSQGITFHRFPSANDVWKNDWVQIIRECRNENNWNPSKSSVICSKHFEENDLYTTKGGLLRVDAYAVPKKFLFKTSSIQEEQPAKVNTSSASHEVHTKLGCLSKGEEQPAEVNTSSASHGVHTKLVCIIKEEQPDEVNTSSASHEVHTKFGCLIKEEEQPADANTSSASHGVHSKLVCIIKEEEPPAEANTSSASHGVHTKFGCLIKEEEQPADANTSSASHGVHSKLVCIIKEEEPPAEANTSSASHGVHTKLVCIIKEEQPAAVNTSSASYGVHTKLGCLIKEEQPSEENTTSASHGVHTKLVCVIKEEEQPAEVNTSSASHGSSIVIEPVDSGSGQLNELEQTFSQNETTPLQILSGLQDQSAEANTSSASQVSSSVVGGFSVQSLTLELKQTCLLSTISFLPHELPAASGVELEQRLLVLYTPRKRNLMQQLIKMHTLSQKRKKKIKILNQKVRRLEKRNKSLKNKLIAQKKGSSKSR